MIEDGPVQPSMTQWSFATLYLPSRYRFENQTRCNAGCWAQA